MSARLAALAVVALTTFAPAATASTTPTFAGCAAYTNPGAPGAVRPHGFTIACGDGNFYVTGLRWSSWSATAAQALGVGHQNDCDPYCAAGHFHTYRVRIRLDAVTRCAPRRVPEFIRVTWTFVGARPTHVPRTGSDRFRCT